MASWYSAREDLSDFGAWVVVVFVIQVLILLSILLILCFRNRRGRWNSWDNDWDCDWRR